VPVRRGGVPGLDRGPGRTPPFAPAGLTGRLLARLGTPHGIGWRWLVALAGTLLAAVGISRLRIDDDLRALVRDSSVDFRLTDEVAASFGSPDQDCLVRATAHGGDLFTADALAELRQVVTRLEALDGVAEVRSIFDVRRQGTAGALLPVIPRTDAPLDPAALAAAKDRAVRHPLIAGHLLSDDGGSALVLVRLTAPGLPVGRALRDRQPPVSAPPPPTTARLVHDIDRLLAAASGPASPLTFSLTGLPALREQAAAALRHDMLWFNSMGLVFAVVLSASVARSLRSTLVASVPPFIGAVWAIGLLGLAGAPVNILTSVVPSLALVVGTCDSIHFIEDMRRSARRGLDPLAASSGALHRVGMACGLTSLVTAIGFASLAAARIDAVRHFGIAAAVGALASFAAVTLLTPLIASLPYCSGLRLGRSSRPIQRFAGTLAAFSLRHARPLVAVGVGATLVCMAIGAGLDADNRVIDSLPRRAPAARALAGVDADFGGTMGVDVAVRWPAGIDWRDPSVVEALAGVHDVLDATGDISPAISLATIAGPLPARARSRLAAADFRDLVSPEGQLAVVRARVPDLGSRQLERVYDRVDTGLADLSQRHPGWRFDLAGMSVVSARNIRQLVRDLGSSLLVEVLVIGGIMAAAFRSPLAGLVSLVPNLFPLAIVGAVLVGLGRSLDPATVIVFNVCLGLAVDDTVHVLSALSRHRREGISIETAVRRAVAETGNPVVIGGLVLMIGFSAVTASSVPSLAGFGVVACAAIAAATVAELIFLPALLVVTDRLVQARWPRFSDGIFGAEPVAWQPLGAPEAAA
jgi:predicted RND superfamily exporter protein